MNKNTTLNIIASPVYIWNKESRKYENPRIPVGHIVWDDNGFVPNKYLVQLFLSDSVDEQGKLIVQTVIDKYGESVREAVSASFPAQLVSQDDLMTTRAIFYGPELAFGSITAEYHIDRSLRKAFGNEIATDILSLAWYMASEGSALRLRQLARPFRKPPRSWHFEPRDNQIARRHGLRCDNDLP
jgi:hypothetical protein